MQRSDVPPPRADDARAYALLAPLHDAPTALAVGAERAFLAALEGGCQVPIGAVAVITEGQPMLYGLIADVGGGRVLRGEQPIDAADPAASGVAHAPAVSAIGCGTGQCS